VRLQFPDDPGGVFSVLPLIAVLVAIRTWFIATTIFAFVNSAGAGAAVYGIGLLWAIWTRKAWV